MARKKSATPRNPNESKAEKFKRLATLHTNAALKRIERLGKLTTGAYESTKDQHKAITDALYAATEVVEKKYEVLASGKKTVEEKRFTL